MKNQKAIELIRFVRFGGPGSGRNKEGGDEASTPSFTPVSPTDKGVTDLMERAKESGPEVDKLTKEVTANNNAVATDINYKSADSITRKANDEEKGDLTQIKDAVRTTIVHEDDQSIKNIIKELGDRPEVINGGRIKTQDKDSNSLGYSGNIVNFKTANGLTAEIQVNTPKMIYAKENEKTARGVLGNKKYDEIYKQTGVVGGKGHGMYEEHRKLNKETDGVRMREIEKESKKYYKNFY